MSAVREYISKYLIPVVLLIAGIIVLVLSFVNAQNNYVKLGGLTFLIAGIITLLYAMSIISRKIQSGLILLLLLSTLGLAYANYNTIDRQLDFISERKEKDKAVIKRLKDIRDIQIAYKDENKEYAKSFGQLVNFIENDSVTVVYSEGNAPDSLTVGDAYKLGIIIRDTSQVAVKDTLFQKDYPADSLKYIPGTPGNEFRIDAGEVEKNEVKVKVFEVFAPYKYIYHDLNTENQNIDLEEGLKVGSMEDPTTTGNWE